MELLRLAGDETAVHHLVGGLSNGALLILIAVCVVLLSKGADWMVEGVVDLARRTGLPKIIIGATIVSLGTTTPEAFVSVMAAFMGNSGLALGNGVGSIIADTGLIFGLTCVLAPVPINRFVLDRTGWVQVASATLLVVISAGAWIMSDGTPRLERWVGFVFLGLLAVYMYLAYVWARQGDGAVRDEDDSEGAVRSLGLCWTMIGGGLAMVIIGARVLIPCASEIAQRLGVPDDVIAATMVAFGTSLPELITAIAAVRKGHPEITVGNIVGADVLNCLFVIGASAAARPLAVPATFFILHFPAMLLLLYSLRAFISLGSGRFFHRWHGFWLLSVYIVYVLLQYVTDLIVPGR